MPLLVLPLLAWGGLGLGSLWGDAKKRRITRFFVLSFVVLAFFGIKFLFFNKTVSFYQGFHEILLGLFSCSLLLPQSKKKAFCITVLSFFLIGSPASHKNLVFYAMGGIPLFIVLGVYLNDAFGLVPRKKRWQSSIFLVLGSLPLAFGIFLGMIASKPASPMKAEENTLMRGLSEFRNVENRETLLFTASLPTNPHGYYWRLEAYNIFDGEDWESAHEGRREEDRRCDPLVLQYSPKVTVKFTKNWNYSTFPTLENAICLKTFSDTDSGSSLPLNEDEAGVWRGALKRDARQSYAFFLDNPDWKKHESDAHVVLADNPKIQNLAKEFIQNAKSERFIAQNIAEGLRSNYNYRTQLPPRGESPLEDFLFRQKEGHCVFFSTAMAVLLQSLGINARIVSGFYSNEYRNGELFVRASHAHSWVEVWIPDTGWVSYDPTPSLQETPIFIGVSEHWDEFSLDHGLLQGWEFIKANVFEFCVLIIALLEIFFGIMTMFRIHNAILLDKRTKFWTIWTLCLTVSTLGLALWSSQVWVQGVSCGVSLGVVVGLVVVNNKRKQNDVYVFYLLKNELFKQTHDKRAISSSLEESLRLAQEWGCRALEECFCLYASFRFGGSGVSRQDCLEALSCAQRTSATRQLLDG